MLFTAAVAATEAAILAIPEGGLGNGSPYVNTSTPATSHIRSHLKWPMFNDGKPRSLQHHICTYARVDLDTAGRTGEKEKASIDVAVIVAVGRLAAARYYGWTLASFNPAELVLDPDSATDLAVHRDHEADVAEALGSYASSAARYMGLFYYNSISYETCAHHHLPAVSKRLASTTIQLAGLKEWVVGEPEKEGSVFHDMFHPLTDTEKSSAARRTSAKQHLSNLKFDNLRKRIPVKAPDSGIALNYPVLYAKAKSYRHDPAHVPATLAPPPNVGVAIAAYVNAANPNTLLTAVDKLRKISEALGEPSAYLTGFILGKDASALGDSDLDLKTAARTNTILGSPAYARAAAEFSGSFTAGKESGFKTVASSVPDQVVPRCEAAMVTASTL